MNENSRSAPGRGMSVGARLTLLVVGIVAFGIALLTVVITNMAARELEARAREDLARGNRSIIATVNTFSGALLAESDRFLGVYKSYFPGRFSVDDRHRVSMGGRTVPALLHDGKPLNNEFTLTDEFSARAHVVATLFVRDGPDFIRVTTSLKKEDGSRAVGTSIDHANPAFPLLLSGKSYGGPAVLFDRPYITRYEPIRDEAGNVLGAFFVGVEIGSEMQALQHEIASIRIGQSGYYTVIDAGAGKRHGSFIVDPSMSDEANSATAGSLRSTDLGRNGSRRNRRRRVCSGGS